MGLSIVAPGSSREPARWCRRGRSFVEHASARRIATVQRTRTGIVQMT
jgi:hypothetical protein